MMVMGVAYRTELREENDHIDQSQQDNGDDVLDFQFIGVCSTHG